MYPEDSIQAFVSSWWVEDKAPGIKRGRLVWGFIPHVSQVPMVLIPVGRSDPTDHERMNYRLEPLKAVQYPKLPHLPVAALPVFEGEALSIYKAKKRPLLVVSTGGPEIPKAIIKGSPKSQSLPTMLVAPYYGAGSDEKGPGSMRYLSKGSGDANTPNICMTSFLAGDARKNPFFALTTYSLFLFSTKLSSGPLTASARKQ